MELLIADLLEKEKIGIRPITRDEFSSLEKALRTDKQRLRSRACHHLFMHSLTSEERIRLLFEKTIGAALSRNRFLYDEESKSTETDSLRPSVNLSRPSGGILYCRQTSSAIFEDSDEDLVLARESRLVPPWWKEAFRKLRILISSKGMS